MLFDFSIDRGGTFTDIYCEITNGRTGDHHPYVTKLLSVDPLNYSDAPTEGIRRILSQFGTMGEISRNTEIPTNEIRSIRMGTTVATNALLERKGDKVALLISEGLRDTLEIGNQSRPKIFDLEIKTPTPVYERVIEVKGGRLRPLHENEIETIGEESIDIIKGSNNQKYVVEGALNLERVRQDLMAAKEEGTISSIAIVLMHSYAHQAQEEAVEKIAREVGFSQISLSSKVMPRVKLVERGQTCCVDAYLNPHIFRYLESFVRGFDEKLHSRVQVFFMQSDGGLAPVDKFTGSKAILSGPAGGVVGYSTTSRQSQIRSGAVDLSPVIGFDMGGTSTDVSRYHYDYEHIFETEIAGTSIQAPQLNINTVAAGGGSRLTFEKGLYKVGPESTGADPGPVCYRKNGGALAVTDANLILGRLLPKYFPKIFGATEDQPLDKQLATDVLQTMTDQINAENGTSVTVHEVALGFIKVANEAMSRPIRSLTQGRGFNPKSHILDVFGGAGAQHACAIAKGLGISKVYIHQHCGILSAYGLGLADVV